MKPDEWKTIAIFGGLMLAVSIIDSRIAYIAMAALGLMIVVTNGSAIVSKFSPSQGGSTAS